jgi:hypothetical protein
MKLTLPEVPCWNCPEGTFPATCRDVRITTELKNGRQTEFLLVVFEIDVDDDDNVQYLAKRKYELPMKTGSPLMNDLAAWIGADALKKQRQWDPTTLKGKRADVALVHIHNEGYPKPFVYVQTISAPGSLVPESVPESRTLIPDNPQFLRLDNIR